MVQPVTICITTTGVIPLDEALRFGGHAALAAHASARLVGAVMKRAEPPVARQHVVAVVAFEVAVVQVVMEGIDGDVGVRFVLTTSSSKPVWLRAGPKPVRCIS